MSKSTSGHFSGTKGLNSQLMQELENTNIKFSKKDMLFITKDKTGQTVWLEKGNRNSGLEHIITRHAKDFQAKHCVSSSHICEHLNNVFRSGKIEYSREIYRNGRTGYERLYCYNGKYYMQTGIGKNGYIVSAYPIDKADAVKLIERYKG